MGIGKLAFGSTLQKLGDTWQEREKQKREQNFALQRLIKQYGLMGELAEIEAKLKQKYPDPFMAMLAKQYDGLGLNGQSQLEIDQSQPGQISIPSGTAEQEKQKIIQQGFDPEDYKIEPVYSTMKGMKVISGYQSKEIPKKALGEEQSKALVASSSALTQLDSLEKLVKTGKVTTGFGKLQSLPFGVRAIRFGAGTDEDLQFSQVLRDFQNSYITAKTGAQRGFPELMYLTIALPGGDIPKDKLLVSINTARDAMKKNYLSMLKEAKKQKRDISGYTEDLKNLKLEFGEKKSGGQLMIDSNGNKAMVYPDGSYEEVK